MRIFIAFAALAAILLAGCGRPTGTAPQGSDVAAAMPDTSQPRDPNAAMTVPDAGATGVVQPEGAPAPTAPPPAEEAPN